jgi:hypothetical protein
METHTDVKETKDAAYRHDGSSTSRGKWVFTGFAAIAVFLLFTEHRAHLLGVLPWLFLAACPLMHFFHHGGHRHHHGTNTGDGSKGESK